MARLPQPGKDNGVWGDILNDYLDQAHKADGTLKDNAVTANNVAPNSITNAAIATDAVNTSSIANGSITEALLDTALQTQLHSPDFTSTPTINGIPVAQVLTVKITTTGATFNPTVELASGSTATVTWILPSGSNVTGINPTINFGSVANRTVRMAVTDGGFDALDQVVTFNLGFDHTQDSGTYNIGSGYDKSPESVSAVTGITNMKGLLRFCASNITTLNTALDFSGLGNLQHIECYGSRVTSVNVSGCDSLIRLCMEFNNMTTLNLNPVAANLFDLRGAHQIGASLTLTNLAIPLVNLYHFCVVDEIITNMPNLTTMLPSVEQLWIWNTGQSGTLAPGSNKLSDVRAYTNSYTSADFTNKFISGYGWLDMYNCSLSSITLTGCTALFHIDLHTNSFNQAAVDGILSVVNSWNTSSGTINLSGNTVPSAAGLTDKTNLESRGWTVTVDGGGGGGSISLVQVRSFSSTSAAMNFLSPVSAGNTVVMAIGLALGTGTATSAPQFNGSSVTGAYAVFDNGVTNGIANTAGADHAYGALWVLPNLGAGNGVAITESNFGFDAGAVLFEVSGLGTSPVVDQSSPGNGNSTGTNSGTTGATTVNDEFIVGFHQTPNGASPPGAPWTVTNVSFFSAGYQIQTVSGATYSWVGTGGATDSWVAGVAAIHA